MRVTRPALLPALFAALWALWPGLALGAPTVCGNQAALGNFDTTQCPVLLDDGVAPDQVKGDGIYTLGVQLQATAYLEYKVLTSGQYAPQGTEITGTCTPVGGPQNPDNNIIVPNPDVSQPTLFFYDSRNLTDPSYAPVKNNQAAGDSIMIAAPKGGNTHWVVVGDFQAKAFDAASGADLVEMPGGVLQAQVVTTTALPAGWQWKVLEGLGTYTGARKFGTSGAADDAAGHDGWSYTPCDSHNVRVARAVSAGTTITFVFDSHYGRLQTILPTETADLLGPPRADLLAPPTDGAVGEGGTSDLNPGQLPGIHCNCQVGRRERAAPSDGLLGGALLVLCGLWPHARGWRRRRARGDLEHGFTPSGHGGH
jgi:hypothetical protein